VKFSICNELFEGWSWEKLCQTAAEVGYDGVEIAPFTLCDRPRDLSERQRDQLRAITRNHGLEIVGLHWLMVKPEGLYLTHSDAGIRAITQAHLMDLVHLCRDLEGKVMVLGSPKQRNVLPALHFEQAWALAREVLIPVARAAEDCGITICFEPLAPSETNFINTADQAVGLIEEIGSPSFQLLLDVKAMTSEAVPPEEIIREHGEHLRHFHANDANLGAPGSGDTDFVPIAEALRDIRYQGYVSVEVFDFRAGAEAIARNSLAYLREVFGNPN